jgi:hypothetical protein
MAQQSIEERLAFLESKIAEYEAERAQMRTLERLRAGQSELREMTNLTEGQQELRGGQHALQAGQDQILAILTGKAKGND